MESANGHRTQLLYNVHAAGSKNPRKVTSKWLLNVKMKWTWSSIIQFYATSYEIYFQPRAGPIGWELSTTFWSKNLQWLGIIVHFYYWIWHHVIGNKICDEFPSMSQNSRVGFIRTLELLHVKICPSNTQCHISKGTISWNKVLGCVYCRYPPVATL